ncbi:MAG TPA: site-specific integrase [Myxococcales bacterium]
MKTHKGVFVRGSKLWMRLRVRPGEWKNLPTKYRVGEEAQAAELRRLTQERLDAGHEFTEATGAPPTVESFGRTFLKQRRELGVRSVDDDESRLKTHVYPVLGPMRLEEVQPRHVADVIAKVRAQKLAPRTVRNVYSVVRALFRDAQIAGLCSQQPCILTHFQLGKVRDGKKGWRAGAVFSREELEALISDPGIPQDRRVLYALASVGCLRHGEAAGLRWRDVVFGLEPLGRIVVLTSYDQGDTKTGAERWMPMHPVLAAMLAEWKLAGWAREQGRAPAPDDLVVPHSRPTNRGPRVEFGGMRSDHDSYKRLRKDLTALGKRLRRFHDFRRTGITLFREDGAERDVLRLCTHGAPGQDVMELYTSFGWSKLCAQVQPLKLHRGASVSSSSSSPS